MKYIPSGINTIAIIIIGFCVMSHSRSPHASSQAPHAPIQPTSATEQRIMSIRELQTFLNEQGHSRYTCEIDGKMGKETQTAWDNYICDRNYRESTYE